MQSFLSSDNLSLRYRSYYSSKLPTLCGIPTLPTNETAPVPFEELLTFFISILIMLLGGNNISGSIELIVGPLGKVKF